MIVNKVIPKYPKQLHIEITNACNLSCFFCPIKNVRKNRGKPLTDEEIFSYIRQGADLGVDYIDFVNYGETLLHPKWFEFVTFTNKLMGSGKVGMVTNSTIMDEKIVEQFLASSFCLLMFSVDGFSKEGLESVRIGANRDQVYKNVEFYLNYLAKHRISGYVPVVAMIAAFYFGERAVNNKKKEE